MAGGLASATRTTTGFRVTGLALAVILCSAAFLQCGCHSGPVPVYSGPEGMGRLRYDKDKGIYREGSRQTSAEQMLFDAAKAAYSAADWPRCIANVDAQLLAYPDGGRAVDAILLRFEARMEALRAAAGGLPRVVPVDGWFFLYLSPSYDPRIRAFMAKGGENAAIASELRARSFESFIEWITPDARAIQSAGGFAPLAKDIRLLVNYYLPAMEFEDYRLRTAEYARNLAWLCFAAKAYDLVVSVAGDVQIMNPPPAIKADVLFVEGLSLLNNGAHHMAANAFNRLFRGANLRDTDTPWRPYALYWLIVATVRKAKGPQYDIAHYEQGIELLGDYDLYLLENPGMSTRLRERFDELIHDIYQVMIERDLDAARTYGMIGRAVARDYYIAHAEEWRKARDKRLGRTSTP